MSAMKMNAVVKDVEIRGVKRRDGSGEMTLYDVVIEDGSKWTAFERVLAEQAWNLRGQQVVMDVTVEQKGNYTNKNVKTIVAANGNSPSMTGTAPTSFGETVAPTRSFGDDATPKIIPTTTTTFSPSPAGTTPTPNDENIWRQVATKVAARLSPDSETDFWANVETLVRFYATGQKPNIIGGLIESGQVKVGAADLETSRSYDDSEIPF